MSGIIGSAGYLPTHRLDRAAAGIGKGSRAVASFDEDATSMGVEAARRLLEVSGSPSIDALVFTTTNPPYADRTNATALHQALDLPRDVAAFDSTGSVRSAVGALKSALAAAASQTTLLVAGDVRVGLPGSSDERDGGDGAAAVLIGPGEPAQAELISSASVSKEFLDRWRAPSERTARVWEDRFGETEYVPAGEETLRRALESGQLTVGDIDHLVVTGLHTRAVRAALRSFDARHDAVVDDLVGSVGVTGAAHPVLLLADVLERARPGQLVALVVLSDGADCLVLRVGPAAGAAPGKRTVASQLAGREVQYHDMLVWRGLLRREPPRRPDPDRPAAPPSSRNAAWKFGFVGSRCDVCGTRHLPPEQVCLACHARRQMTPERLANVSGTITTFTIDQLAHTVAPPVVAAVIDLDGGGRIQCELADVDASQVHIGDRIEMSFRRMYTTTDGIHNYFWKARRLEQGAP